MSNLLLAVFLGLAVSVSKVGDSLTVNPLFLRGYDNRISLAAKAGWQSSSLLNPKNADKRYCRRMEAPLTCELRQNNPQVVVILIGTNDLASGIPVEWYFENLEAIVDEIEVRGATPILTTLPPINPTRANAEDWEAYNNAIRRVATGNGLPLIELSDLTPEYFLYDGVHLNADGQRVRTERTVEIIRR